MEEKKGKLFDVPYGASKKSWGLSGKTTEHITCGACGTIHPCIKNSGPDEYYSYSRVGDVNIVDSCCGAYIDKLYEDLGEEFCIRTIKGFIQDPLAKKFDTIRRYLTLAMGAWNKATKKSSNITKAIKKFLSEI